MEISKFPKYFKVNILPYPGYANFTTLFKSIKNNIVRYWQYGSIFTQKEDDQGIVKNLE